MLLMVLILRTTNLQSQCADRQSLPTIISRQTSALLVNVPRQISLSLLPKTIAIARSPASLYTGLSAWEFSSQLYSIAAVQSGSSGPSSDRNKRGGPRVLRYGSDRS